MPEYYYERPSGEILILEMTYEEKERTDPKGNGFERDGEFLARRMDLDLKRQAFVRPTLWTKHQSDALAVDPSQVPEAIEEARSHGVPTDYQADGTPIIRSKKHKAKLAKALGMNWTGE